ncbi:hypothetical protein ACVXG7_27955 [Enterobacter hormaechei]
MRLLVASNWLGMPCWQPPFGEIVALDMHTGDVKWRRPVGASQQWLLHAGELGFTYHWWPGSDGGWRDLHRCFNGCQSACLLGRER